MKGASLQLGAYSAYLLRCMLGFAIIAPVWWFSIRRWPTRAVLRIHVKRGVVVAFMGWSFFFSLVRLPLAEAIAISFVAPLIALYLAAVILGERIERRAIIAAILRICGVLVIVGARISRAEFSNDEMVGLGTILLSAVLYAWNLVLQRKQALVARPTEVSTFQNGVVALVLSLGAPFLLQWPGADEWLTVGAASLLAIGAALCLAWAYARAEAQALVPIEYTGFLWAALFGWIWFGESLAAGTIGGAALIVIACWIATRRRPEQSAV